MSETIRTPGGEELTATRIKYLGTLTTGGANIERELYRLDDGREVICESPSHDCRALPTIEMEDERFA